MQHNIDNIGAPAIIADDTLLMYQVQNTYPRVAGTRCQIPRVPGIGTYYRKYRWRAHGIHLRSLFQPGRYTTGRPVWRIRLSSSLVGIRQFREFEFARVHTRINSWGLFLVHKLTCGKRESVS